MFTLFLSPLWLLNLTIALGSLLLLAATIALSVDYFKYHGRFFGHHIIRFSWPLIIGITTVSVVMSLIYSEYFGFIPCSLCWLQRIAIYPQAILSIMAWRLKDSLNFPLYGIGLSIFGVLVAIYQYIFQMVPATVRDGGALPCLADGSGADCANKVIDLFGFVTFPFVSAVTFLFLIMLYLYRRRFSSEKTGL